MSSEKKPQPVAYTHPLGGLCRIPLCEDPKKDGWIPLYSEATIEALRAERDEARKNAFENGTELCRQRTRAETAEARVAQLEAERGAFREALEPFAKMADHIDNLGHEPGSTSLHRLKANDLRRARALLSDGGRENV